jgi:hypothetical protein
MDSTMKKYIVFLFLIFMSCEKDLIETIDTPTQTMIFDLDEVSIQDGQDISFEIITNEQHQLIISTQEGSVISKETFQPELGINTRKIWTKLLPNTKLKLSLVNSSKEELYKTNINVN